MTGSARHRHRAKPVRNRLRRPLHVAAVTVGAAAVASWSLGPTFAATDSGDVEVVNTETVQVYTDAEGAVDTKRVYEQVELSGQGTVTLENPIALEGLRNLDGFGGVETEDGSQVTTTTIDGVEQLRSVSEFDGDLPVEVSATYELDGEAVEPGDVVGESGHLVVEYTIKNVSGVATDISYPDGRGGEVTDTVDVPIPMVGSLTTVAPPTFDEVTSAQANMAGDGKGGTRLSFTATLIPPIGDDTAVFGYEADITDGVVPRADFTGLPVNPLKSPSFASAAKSYQGGAQTGVALTEGAVEIDENLLKLRDGAGDLLAGLIKLQAGSEELSAGLVNEAAPGAQELATGLNERAAPGAEELASGLNDDAAPGAALLADGAGTLSDGLGDLDQGATKLAGGNATLNAGVGVLADGTGELRVGARKLADGADRVADGAGLLAGGSTAALDGSQQLTAGLGQLSAGLQQLKGMDGLPKAKAGAEALQVGIDALVAGLGDAEKPLTLVGGLTALAGPEGLPEAAGGAQQIAGGLGQLRGTAPTGPDSPGSGLAAAKGGVDSVNGALAPLADGGLDAMVTGLGNAAATPECQSNPVCVRSVVDVQNQLAALKPELLKARGGLAAVSTGLGTAIGSLDGALIPGVTRLAGSLQTASTGAGRLRDGAVAARDGALQIQGGLVQLNEGLASAVQGVLALSTGADSAFLGGRDLTTGLGTLDDGAAELAAGTVTLSKGGEALAAGTGKFADGVGELGDGAQKLADGSSELAAGATRAAEGSQELTAGAAKLSAGIGLAADGSRELSNGLGDAADGSQELADGLGDAADGSVRLADGLDTAADGAPQLVDGAQRLSDEGTKVLIGKGEDTAKSYGEMYASLVAGAERADTDDMAYGAPEGAEGLTAYSFVLQGEDGAGGRNLGRGLLAGGAAALAGGGLLIRRRFLA